MHYKENVETMNTNWPQFLSTVGAHIDTLQRQVDFGNTPAELEAARDANSANVIAPLLHLGLLECTGEDAQAFLHGQLTSDIAGLAANAAQHSAWCSPKGRMLANFLIFHQGTDYRLQFSADLVPAIHQRLQMFVLRAKVKISNRSADCVSIGLSGKQAATILQTIDLPVPAQALETAAFADGQVIRLDATRFMIVANSTAATGLWPKLAARAHPVGTAAWQWLDIQAGIPLITEASKEEFIPQMLDFEQLGGVSFKKGCYPGQEIVARTQYLGKVKRRLYRIHADAPMMVGNSLYSLTTHDQACGLIVNTAPAPGGGHDALAVIQENDGEIAADLRLNVADGPPIAVISSVL